MTPAPASAPYPRLPGAHKHWCEQTRKRLRYLRQDAEEWDGCRYTALPHPSWLVQDFEIADDTPPHLVRDALSDVQRRIYSQLRDIGQGKHNRPATGARSQIAGCKTGPNDYTVRVSHGSLAMLLGLPVNTVRDNLARLEGKHMIVRHEVRSRGEKRGKNRVESVFRLPPFNDVLAAIRADPNIATTHGDKDPKASIAWDNGRRDSRKFLTPAQAEQWRLQTLPPRPKTDTAEKPAAELPAGESRAIAPPARKGSEPLPAVPPDQQAKIDELCGRTVGSTFTVYGTSAEPMKCDLAPAMLQAAIANAAARDKVFPPDALYDLCLRFFNRARKTARVPVVDDAGRQVRSEELLVWSAHMPAAYLLSCCKTDGEAVDATLDTLGRRAMKREREAREKVAAAIGLMRQHPGDVAIWQHGEQLSREYSDVWLELYAADDRKHGGDGSGSSWRKPLPREPVLKGDALLADLLKKAGGPSS